MKLIPLASNIILIPFEDKQETSFGFIIPDTVEGDKPEMAEIVAIGSDVDTVEVGQTVLFKKWSPDEIESDGKKYLVIHEGDVIAIYE